MPNDNMISPSVKALKGELCGLSAGLTMYKDWSPMESVRKLYPPRCWTGMQGVGSGHLISDYHNVHADMQWYGCEVPEGYKNGWKKTNRLPEVDKELAAKVKVEIQKYVSAHNFTDETLKSLQENWNCYVTQKVISTDLEEVKKDINNMLYIHPETKTTVFHDLSHPTHTWHDKPWDALESAFAADVAAGGDIHTMLPFFVLAHKVVSMAFSGGKYKAQAVAATDQLVGERIVLCSLLVGQEQIKLGYNPYWVRHCAHLRLMTYRAMCGAYARGVIAHGECTLRQVFNAGGSTPPITGNVMWSRMRAAYCALLPRELGDIVQKTMRVARAQFVYPAHSKRDITEMNAWCDITTFDWYALCGPTAENVTAAGVGALMLGYECEVLVDMCPNVTYEDYMAFIAAGVDAIPHMDSKELVAGAFAAHACGVKGFPGLDWLHTAIDAHTKKGGSMWGPRSVDGAAYLMFLGINEGCRQPAIPYGDVRMRAEINLMAAHEVAGLFRHGMEGDAMSRSMLDEDASIASFPKMIDTLAENSVLIGEDMGPPHNTGFMLTSFGYLLFNLLGSSSMMRWASQAKPRCDSISIVSNKEDNAKLPQLSPEEATKAKQSAAEAMTRDMMKVSTLAAHRALRLGIETDYVDTHPHITDGDCVCWNCIAGDDAPCSCN